MAVIRKDGKQIGTLGSGVAAHLSAGSYEVVARYRSQEKRFDDVQIKKGERTAPRSQPSSKSALRGRPLTRPFDAGFGPQLAELAAEVRRDQPHDFVGGRALERLGRDRARLHRVDAAQHLAHERQRDDRHRQLAIAEADHDRQHERVRRHVAAHRERLAVAGAPRARPCRACAAPPGSSDCARYATAGLLRSTASPYCTRSLVPTDRKSHSSAKRSAIITAEGSSIITPTSGLPDRHRRARVELLARELERGARLAQLLEPGHEREHQAHRPLRRRAQHRAQLRAEQLRPRQRQPDRAQPERRIRHRRRREAALEHLAAHVDRAHRDRVRRVVRTISA